MNSEVKLLSKGQEFHKQQTESTFIEKIKPHGELIAALASGLFIFLSWVLSKFQLDTVETVLLIIAFTVGGYAKAKEGIEKTFENRELNVEMLMIFAAIGSVLIGYWAEGAVLIFIFALSGALETYTLNKSHREISSLMALQPEEALLLNNGEEEKVHVSQLNIGDHILVKPGERIPSDGKLVRGQTTIDEATITGEAVPVLKGLNDEIFAGTVNIRGSITIEITKPSHETLFQKIIQLVQSAQSEKSPSQLFIERFEGVYVKVILAVVVLMMILPYFLFGWSWTETFYRAMILLVVASPCALVAAIMPATLSAISNGARHGILFKGGIHLEKLAHLQAIAFDKTGTLTKGKPVVTDIYVREGIAKEDFLLKTASIERHSTHPLAQAIIKYAEQTLQKKLIQPDYIEDTPGFGVLGSVYEQQLKIGKADFVGKEAAESFENGIAITLAAQGKTIVYVQDDQGLVGLLALKDVVRDEAKTAIDELKRLGIHTIMLTGDAKKTAEAIAKESNIDHHISECLPENKVDELKNLMKTYESVAMVGDGINDAPALATASVGIAMGEGTDVALETADVVLMKNNLPKISEAIRLSKRMNQIVQQNIIFSITVIMLLISLNFLQMIDLPYSILGHEGSTILVILNGLRLLR